MKYMTEWMCIQALRKQRLASSNIRYYNSTGSLKAKGRGYDMI